MIVKVQLPLFTNAPEREALIYPKGKPWIEMQPEEVLPAWAAEELAKTGKAYFNARIEHGNVVLVTLAPWQEW